MKKTVSLVTAIIAAGAVFLSACNNGGGGDSGNNGSDTAVVSGENDGAAVTGKKDAGSIAKKLNDTVQVPAAVFNGTTSAGNAYDGITEMVQSGDIVSAGVIVAGNASPDECAVFECKDEAAAKVALEKIEAHIKEQETNYSSYKTDEKYKVDGAVKDTYKNYAYCFVGENVSGIADELRAAVDNGVVLPKTAKDAADAIAEAYGDAFNTGISEVPADMLEGKYGITADLYDEVASKMPLMSTRNDLIIVVKPKADKTDAVVAALEKVRTDLIGDTLQYPVNIDKTNAATVTQNGGYVAFILAGGAEPADLQTADVGSDDRVKWTTEQNAIGVAAFMDYSK